MSHKLIHSFSVNPLLIFFFLVRPIHSCTNYTLYTHIYHLKKSIIFLVVITWNQVIHNKLNVTCFVLTSCSDLNGLPVKIHEATLLHLTNVTDIVSLHFTMWLQKRSCFIFFSQDLNLKIQKGPFGAQIFWFIFLHPAARKYINIPASRHRGLYSF